jgi:hypothetical protein
MAETNTTFQRELTHMVKRLGAQLGEEPEHVARQAMANAMGEVVRYQREGDRPELEPDPLMEFAVDWMKAASPELRAEFTALMETTVVAGGGCPASPAFHQAR